MRTLIDNFVKFSSDMFSPFLYKVLHFIELIMEVNRRKSFYLCVRSDIRSFSSSISYYYGQIFHQGNRQKSLQMTASLSFTQQFFFPASMLQSSFRETFLGFKFSLSFLSWNFNKETFGFVSKSFEAWKRNELFVSFLFRKLLLFCLTSWCHMWNAMWWKKSEL